MTDQPQDLQAQHEEENQLIAQRKAKLASVREQGIAFPNDFRRDSLCADLQKAYEDKSKEELEAAAGQIQRSQVLPNSTATCNFRKLSCLHSPTEQHCMMQPRYQKLILVLRNSDAQKRR